MDRPSGSTTPLCQALDSRPTRARATGGGVRPAPEGPRAAARAAERRGGGSGGRPRRQPRRRDGEAATGRPERPLVRSDAGMRRSPRSPHRSPDADLPDTAPGPSLDVGSRFGYAQGVTLPLGRPPGRRSGRQPWHDIAGARPERVGPWPPRSCAGRPSSPSPAARSSWSEARRLPRSPRRRPFGSRVGPAQALVEPVTAEPRVADATDLVKGVQLAEQRSRATGPPAERGARRLRHRHLRPRRGQAARARGGALPRLPVRRADDVRGGRARGHVGPPVGARRRLYGGPGHRRPARRLCVAQPRGVGHHLRDLAAADQLRQRAGSRWKTVAA